MNLLIDMYKSVITEDESTEVSTFISMNFAELVVAFRKEGMDPEELFSHMNLDDLIATYGTIKTMFPEFNLDDYLYLADDCDAKYYVRDMVQDCDVSPDAVVLTWPNLLTLRQKLAMKVSPDLIVETEPYFDQETAIKLLDLGADPNKVVCKAQLTTEQKIKYGVNPHLFISSALWVETELIRNNLAKLLSSGLDPLELMRVEEEYVIRNFHQRFETFDWYIDNLELLLQHTDDKDAFFEAFMSLVMEIVYSDDLMPLETEDILLIRSMRKAVELGLIELNDAIEYLHNIHDEYIDEDDDGNPIPHPSILLDRDVVRAELAA